MLLTKTIKLKWNGKNKKWYESKGYKFTKFGDEIEVNVEDLSKGNSIKVQVECDNCRELLNIRWCDYLKFKHDNNKYYCNKCATKLSGKEKELKTKLKKGKSFYTWCYENLDKKQADNILSRWNYDLNKCSPKEILYSSHGVNEKGYWFKCDKHPEHESELHSIHSFVRYYIEKGMSNALICLKCNSFAQWGIDNIDKDFLEKYWDYDKNTLNPWNISYSSHQKIWIRCQEHDYHESYSTICKAIINGNRCPYCTGRKVHPKDSLGQYIIDNYGQEFLNKVWSDKNKKSCFEYSHVSGQKAWFKCIDGKHKDYYRKISDSHNYDFRCPYCVQERDESFLQEKVRLYLEKLNIGQVLHEYDCTILPINPKKKWHNHCMPFDNELIINNKIHLIIEVNGLQHYEITGFHKKHAKRANTTPAYEFHMQQVRDRYKRIYAKSKGYEYLEIPYWTDNEDEEWRTLINNKIDEILK